MRCCSRRRSSCSPRAPILRGRFTSTAIATTTIALAKARGFRVNINTTLFDGIEPERVARFFDEITEMGVDGITVSPGYAYERAPDQEHFLNRRRTKEL